jgi:hypothetical protein
MVVAILASEIPKQKVRASLVFVGMLKNEWMSCSTAYAVSAIAAYALG